MELSTIIALSAAFLAIALLYSTVGHAGASGYLAVMAFFSLAPAVMRPTALVLNIVVAIVATWKFYRAGTFSWRLFWPFALASIPFAFVGGVIKLPDALYKPVVGVALVIGAVWMVLKPSSTGAVTHPPPIWLGLIVGAGIGLLSGLTGVGGGIFLSPLIIVAVWGDTRQAAGIAAPFILVNSVAGLLGQLASTTNLPPAIPIWAAAAFVGGLIGAEYGSKRFNSVTLRRLLAVVLAFGAIKLVIS